MTRGPLETVPTAEPKDRYSEVLGKIPPELISAFFQACVAMCAPETATSCTIQLSAVCTTWRDIARSIPQLWTTVSIHAHIIRFTGESHFAVKEWISRSKALSIDLYISSASRGRHLLPTDVKNFRQLLSVLGESSNRWRSVSFDVHTSFIRQLCSIAHGLSQIRSMRYSNRCWESIRTRTFTVTSQIGSLKWKEESSPQKLEIDFALFASLAEVLNIRTDNLIHLDIREMSVKQCLDVIRLSPMLLIFKTRISGIEDTVPSSSSPIVHSVLDSFTIESSWRDDGLDQVLSSLILPRLRTLGLLLMTSTDSLIIEDFLRRSSAPITSMKLCYERKGDELDLAGFKAIAVLTPLLNHLCILFDSWAWDGDGELQANLLKYLVDSGKPKNDDPSYSPPLPQLKNLTYISGMDNFVERGSWISWSLVPGLFPISTPASAVASLRPMKAFITREEVRPQEKYLRQLIPLRRAGIDFGPERNNDIDCMKMNASLRPLQDTDREVVNSWRQGRKTSRSIKSFAI
ncbi:hypothetical protein D9613_004525 [Agrocybe pediades]|uniref:F-box domain-containing protein n=1 Tax=Agrocybe pediades TaxID=84607 RepID=A0A8H4VJI4_9AGAR|nr:hypothetical protein D9613_004525 [Agrocybe pediades]